MRLSLISNKNLIRLFNIDSADRIIFCVPDYRMYPQRYHAGDCRQREGIQKDEAAGTSRGSSHGEIGETAEARS